MPPTGSCATATSVAPRPRRAAAPGGRRDVLGSRSGWAASSDVDGGGDVGVGGELSDLDGAATLAAGGGGGVSGALAPRAAVELQPTLSLPLRRSCSASSAEGSPSPWDTQHQQRGEPAVDRRRGEHARGVRVKVARPRPASDEMQRPPPARRAYVRQRHHPQPVQEEALGSPPLKVGAPRVRAHLRPPRLRLAHPLAVFFVEHNFLPQVTTCARGTGEKIDVRVRKER
ncbi:uncharacterized protein LOC111256227 [Setaria italica]|uniref:Uncharacterized protein n=1 Tax=Setaria viridis TaxID=4556 RepID=A0A4U6VTL6_SETVI|nr:uncharacterized protein LOC111256227 [Setaria italica]TKW33251.1 hypothetical protein SEVIR_2G221233v2 [Setaria viridis]